MSWDGMLPQHNCKVCGEPLNPHDHRPAELYMGTYTGLCYSCEKAGPFTEKVSEIDGALSISYPPSCPSYRRDRESHIAYTDCPDCNGEGFHWENTAHATSYYRHYCKTCMKRYCDHPLRKRTSNRQTRLWNTANEMYNNAIRKIAKSRKRYVDVSTLTKEQQQQITEIKNKLLTRYRSLVDKYVNLPF